MSFLGRWLGTERTASPDDDPRLKLRAQLMRHEGLRLDAYRDTEGHLTIGYGYNLDADPALRDRLMAQTDGESIRISEATAERLLDNALAIADDDVEAQVPYAHALDACRRAVLVNMAYNMGIGGLLGFKKMLAAIERKDYARAAAEMTDSRWFHQVGARAVELAAQMETGRWQA